MSVATNQCPATFSNVKSNHSQAPSRSPLRQGWRMRPSSWECVVASFELERHTPGPKTIGQNRIRTTDQWPQHIWTTHLKMERRLVWPGLSWKRRNIVVSVDHLADIPGEDSGHGEPAGQVRDAIGRLLVQLQPAVIRFLLNLA